jgi:ribosome-associated translation inhibitor RaiA
VVYAGDSTAPSLALGGFRFPHVRVQPDGMPPAVRRGLNWYRISLCHSTVSGAFERHCKNPIWYFVMDPPLELTFRNMTPSVELHALIRKCVTRLRQRYDHIIGCCVTVELRSDTRRTGYVPDVLIDVQVPGETLLVRNQNGRSGEVLAAVHHAFDSATRQIEEYKVRRKLRAELCELVAPVGDWKKSTVVSAGW